MMEGQFHDDVYQRLEEEEEVGSSFADRHLLFIRIVLSLLLLAVICGVLALFLYPR